jgi:hypothetical protein
VGLFGHYRQYLHLHLPEASSTPHPFCDNQDCLQIVLTES